MSWGGKRKKKQDSDAGDFVVQGGCCLLEAFAVFSAIALLLVAAPSLLLS